MLHFIVHAYNLLPEYIYLNTNGKHANHNIASVHLL